MKRRLELIDIAVAIGVFATVVGGYLVFMAASGALEGTNFQATAFGPTAGSVGSNDPMNWIQPALGEAIVENELLERRIARDTTAAVRELNYATMTAEYLDSADPQFDRIKAHAEMIDTDEDARVQYVMGRSIVGFTARGVRASVLSPDLYAGEFNRRMIEQTRAAGAGMRESYLEMREPMIGRAIVEAAQRHLAGMEELQHRIGTAVTRIARIQEGDVDGLGEAQAQLASVALASIHTEQIADRFEQLARADGGQDDTATFSEPRTWPEVPVGLLGLLSIGLIGLYCIGLMTPTMRSEEPATQVKPETAPYRKTA
jgi:hypothetical protein